MWKMLETFFPKKRMNRSMVAKRPPGFGGSTPPWDSARLTSVLEACGIFSLFGNPFNQNHIDVSDTYHLHVSNCASMST